MVVDEDDEIYCLETALCDTVVIEDVFVLVLGGQLLVTALSVDLLKRLKPYLESLDDDIALCNRANRTHRIYRLTTIKHGAISRFGLFFFL